MVIKNYTSFLNELSDLQLLNHMKDLIYIESGLEEWEINQLKIKQDGDTFKFQYKGKAIIVKEKDKDNFEKIINHLLGEKCGLNNRININNLERKVNNDLLDYKEYISRLDCDPDEIQRVIEFIRNTYEIEHGHYLVDEGDVLESGEFKYEVVKKGNILVTTADKEKMIVTLKSSEYLLNLLSKKQEQLCLGLEYETYMTFRNNCPEYFDV